MLGLPLAALLALTAPAQAADLVDLSLAAAAGTAGDAELAELRELAAESHPEGAWALGLLAHLAAPTDPDGAAALADRALAACPNGRLPACASARVWSWLAIAAASEVRGAPSGPAVQRAAELAAEGGADPAVTFLTAMAQTGWLADRGELDAALAGTRGALAAIASREGPPWQTWRARAALQEGQLLLAAGQPSEAADRLAATADLADALDGPEAAGLRAESLTGRAAALVAAGRFDEALAAADAADVANETAGTTHPATTFGLSADRAAAHEALGELDDALAALEAAENAAALLGPRGVALRVEAITDRADLLAADGRTVEALATLGTATALTTTAPPSDIVRLRGYVELRRADLLRDVADHPAALAAYDKAWDVGWQISDPSARARLHAWVSLGRADVLEATGRPDHAAAALTVAVQAAEQIADPLARASIATQAHTALGRRMLLWDQADAALVELRKALESANAVRPAQQAAVDRARAATLGAEVARRLGRPQAASEAARAVVTVAEPLVADPAWAAIAAEARLINAWALADQEEWTTAVQAASAAATADPALVGLLGEPVAAAAQLEAYRAFVELKLKKDAAKWRSALLDGVEGDRAALAALEIAVVDAHAGSAPSGRARRGLTRAADTWLDVCAEVGAGRAADCSTRLDDALLPVALRADADPTWRLDLLLATEAARAPAPRTDACGPNLEAAAGRWVRGFGVSDPCLPPPLDPLGALDASRGSVEVERPTAKALRKVLAAQGRTLVRYARDADRLYAFVLGPDGMRVASLGEIPALLDDLTALREAVDPAAHDAAAAVLSARVWRPLGVTGPTTVVRAGPLSSVPLHGLPDAQGVPLLEAVSLAYAPTAASLLRPIAPPTNASGVNLASGAGAEAALRELAGPVVLDLEARSFGEVMPSGWAPAPLTPLALDLPTAVGVRPGLATGLIVDPDYADHPNAMTDGLLTTAELRSLDLTGTVVAIDGASGVESDAIDALLAAGARAVVAGGSEEARDAILAAVERGVDPHTAWRDVVGDDAGWSSLVVVGR